MSGCRGCGAELPPQTWTGRRREWCSDRCRKRQYDRVCVDCGGRCDGASGHAKNATRCNSCYRALVTIGPERVIAAIQEWADEHGGIPPRMPAWDPSHPASTAEEHAEYATGRWPCHTTVRRWFGSWNGGLIAAGFEPHRVKHMGQAVLDEWRQAVLDGEPVQSIAARWDVTPQAVYLRLRIYGTPVSALRRKAAA